MTPAASATKITTQQLLGHTCEWAAGLFAAQHGYMCSFAPNGAAFDLLIWRNNESAIRCEVKVDSKSPRTNAPISAMCKQCDCRKFDLWFAVDANFEVRCIRSILYPRTVATLELTGPEVQSNCTTFKNRERAKRMLEGQ